MDFKVYWSSTLRLYWKQLAALLRKSLIIRKVHFISTFFELISPLLMIIVFAYVYSNNLSSGSSGGGNSGNQSDIVGPVIYKNPQDRVYFDPSLDFIQSNKNFTIVYAPDNDVTQSLLETFRVGNFSWVKLVGYATESEMNAKLELEADGLDWANVGYDSVIGLYFRNSHDSNALRNGQISYKLRVPADGQLMTYTQSLFPTKNTQAPVGNTAHISMYNKFMKVQSYLNRVFVKQTCTAHGATNCDDIFFDIKTKQDKQIHVNRMPYPKYKNPSVSAFSILDIVAIGLPLSFVLVCPLIVKRITDEKSSKAKELLRLIGMSDFVFYFAHFINYLGLILIHTLFVTIIVFVFSTPLYSASSPVVFALGFFLWGAQLILFSMLITTVFNRPVIATIVMTILWIVLLAIIFAALVPSINTNLNVANTNSARLWTSLLPAGSIVWFLAIMGTLENNGVGLHFSNLNSATTVYGGFTALHVLLMTILSYFLYGFLIWYLDNVWPFQHGVPKSPWYLFLPSYWRPREKFSYSESERPEKDPKNFEPEPYNTKAAIRIENVCKVFNRASAGKKVAVNELWLNIYENQITVLLGHNGAGKSTTMNMITGMYGSTSGSIFVNGYNVFTQTKQARRSVGLCPQENIIFNELTVAQHLRLFAALKDYPSDRVEGEIINILTLLKLMDKKDVLATKLSGGMKRKLSLGIALVGETETLILDEPTSGMDPDARRVIWDLLLNIRRHRNILITTHYMEEADVLGDRIAIMNKGRLCCSGTPFFLKNSFGTGYTLRIAKHEGFSSLNFEKVLRRYVPSASLNTEIETEVVYTLDYAQMDKKALLSLLPQMFDDIERNKSAYGVASCGLSYASLEDVFLSVGSDVDLHSSPEHEDFISNGIDNIENGKVLLSNPFELKRGTKLILNQLLGLFLKRIHFARRYWPMMIFQVLIPALIIILAMYLEKAIGEITKIKTSHVDLNVKQIYGTGTQTFVYGLNNIKDAYTRVNEDKYSAIVNSVSNKSSAVDDSIVNEWILNKIGSNLDNYIQKYLYGFGETESTFNNWINYEQLHSLPLSVNVLFESVLRSVLPEALQAEASILVESEPMLMPSREASIGIIKIFISWTLSCLIFMPIAFPFLAASYIMYPITENASKSKLIQLMTGLSPVTFWIANFVFDLFNHLIAITILYLVIYLLDSDHVFTGEGSNGSGGVLYLLLFSFGVSTIPVVYFISYKFEKPSSGFVFLIILFFFVGFIGNILLAILDTLMHNIFLQLSSLSSFWYPFLLFFLRFIPIFSMLFGYQKVQKLSMFSKMCAQFPNLTLACVDIKPDSQNFMRGCCSDVCGDMCYQTANPFAMTKYGAGPEVLYMILTGLVCFIFIILYETYKQQFAKYLSISQWIKMIKRLKPEEEILVIPPLQLNVSEDSDVVKERIRIENEINRNSTDLSDLLVVDKLSKKFGNFTAVEGLTFGVHYNECFGLLGVNGAGKTTTFSMLTGDLLPSSGNAYIQRGEFGLIENLQQFQGNIGYCPQFDALLGKLTGEETLYLFARLRGIPSQYLQRDVNNLIKMVGLESHAHKRTDTYSGGNKRKLSIAIALVGNPPLLFLDEPSAGVDPAARRKIWQTLGYLKRNFNCSIVLTSHSMEECEALCSRIGIMVNGHFKCLGSTQHLRSKYGQGYSVTISLRGEHESNQDYVNSIQQEVSRVLPSSALKDYHQSLMHYHITDPSERWSNIFKQMYSLNDRFDFEDYFVSDTTLEQIFIMFARHSKVETSAEL